MIELSFIVKVWGFGIIIGIGLGSMLYLLGYSIGLIYRMFKI